MQSSSGKPLRYPSRGINPTAHRLPPPIHPQETGMADDILVKRNGAILEVTLNRPADGNGATDYMAADLGKLLLDPGDVQLVLLRGAGADFCTGRAATGRMPRPPGATGEVEAL